MTAILAYAYSDRIEVLSDTAVTNEEGLLLAQSSKLIYLDGNNISLAASGDYMVTANCAMHVLQHTIGMKTEECLQSLPQLMRQGMGQNNKSPICFNVFSFMENKPTIFTINSFETDKKYQLQELMPLSYLGAPLGYTLQDIGVNQTKLDEGLKPVAMNLFNEIRKIPQSNLSTGKKNITIGGALVHTTIRPNKRKIEILGKWHDNRGQKLDGSQELIPQSA